MLPATILKKVLEALAQVEVGAACAEPLLEDQEQADPIIRDAYARLRDNPDLLSGDENGLYSFEDPVLATIVQTVRQGKTLDDEIGCAAAADDNLRNQSESGLRCRDYSKLFAKAVLAWQMRGNEAWQLLGNQVRKDPLPVAHAPFRLAVVGDAGGHGNAQKRVFGLLADRHRQRPFHYVIHLGDTYFGTSEAEMLYNLLEPLSQFRTGETRLATLCGNHDLYYGPKAYHSALAVLGQPGRYFCLEAPGWRILCLDTSLAAERWTRNEGKLDDEPGGQVEWLDKMLGMNDGRRIILLSHHCIISGWDESPSPTLADQLRDRVRNRIFAWYWGHEHRCATFDKLGHGFFGACVGNGVWLEKRTPPPFPNTPGKIALTSWYPPSAVRCNCYRGDGPDFWPHGFLELELGDQEIVETFHLENGSHWHRVLSDNAATAVAQLVPH